MTPASACYLDDLIEGFLHFMDLPGQSGEPGFPAPINLGNPTAFTIRTVVERMVEMTGSKSRIIHRPLPSDEPMQRQPDIRRAQAYRGGWTRRVQLEEGLGKTVTYLDALLTAGS